MNESKREKKTQNIHLAGGRRRLVRKRDTALMLNQTGRGLEEEIPGKIPSPFSTKLLEGSGPSH